MVQWCSRNMPLVLVTCSELFLTQPSFSLIFFGLFMVLFHLCLHPLLLFKHWEHVEVFCTLHQSTLQTITKPGITLHLVHLDYFVSFCAVSLRLAYLLHFSLQYFLIGYWRLICQLLGNCLQSSRMQAQFNVCIEHQLLNTIKMRENIAFYRETYLLKIIQTAVTKNKEELVPSQIWQISALAVSTDHP